MRVNSAQQQRPVTQGDVVVKRLCASSCGGIVQGPEGQGRARRTWCRSGGPQQHLRHAGGGRALVAQPPGGLLRKQRMGGGVQVGDSARVQVQDARPAAAQVEGQAAGVAGIQLHSGGCTRGESSAAEEWADTALLPYRIGRRAASTIHTCIECTPLAGMGVWLARPGTAVRA